MISNAWFEELSLRQQFTPQIGLSGRPQIGNGIKYRTPCLPERQNRGQSIYGSSEVGVEKWI